MRRNLMEEHKQRFGCEKPIIGCLHLRALPGTPLWDPSYTMEQHVADLKEEAHILMELASTEPYLPMKQITPMWSISARARWQRTPESSPRYPGELTIPFGVGIMNDPYSAISVAKAVGAVFCRGFFLGSQVGNYGEIRKTPGDIWRYAKSIGAADVAVYSSFEPHNGSSLDTRSTEEMFNTYYKDTPVAGYSMNGPKKGEKPSESMIAKCKAQIRISPSTSTTAQIRITSRRC